ncbi:hypothetical protein [Flavobacterium sp. GT3R68]|uniref:hypothetical protein n=1 Tax=Flavobacterium sp. GT3R68 TaxID=2594437 RepID=UPI000F8672C4|nr:hypothetical protein [Flavobacterium sp. GT3R68]RTY89368.1 hypothetical protein EKL32_23205 [Flavobacterium sp. GSN2]TRW93928.1 hypothetical protein FNW07_03180 [Flavobacterium sp. GT3R68]
MKKVFLLMLVAGLTLPFNSCSSDNNSTPGDSVTMRVGGVQKTFDTVAVTQTPYTQDGVDYVDLTIVASMSGNPDETVTFGAAKGFTGTGNSWGYSYLLNSVEYNEDELNNPMNSNITVNSNNHLVGTFSGPLTSSGNASVDITQGTFDITY